MYRYLLSLLLFFSTASYTQASHFVASYIDFKVDRASARLDLEYHLFLDSSGISTLPSVTAYSSSFPWPRSMQLDTVFPFRGYFGGPICRAGAYYEAVYIKTIYLTAASAASSWTQIDICPAGDRNYSRNLDNTIRPGLCASFQYRSRNTPNYHYPDIDTRGSGRRTFQNAYADLQNFNDFGRGIQTDFDSLNFILNPIWASTSGYAQYNPGYSAITPLPDVSEDTLNGFNQFPIAQGVLFSKAVASSFLEGNYIVGLRTEYIFKKRVCYRDFSSNVVYYHHRDTSKAPISLRIETPDSSFFTNQPSTVLNYDLDIDDTLVIDITANGPAGHLIHLLSDSILDLKQGKTFNSRFDYNFPRLISRNIGGLFTGLDSNRIRFFFAPKAGNLELMRHKNQFGLVFGSDSCGGDVHSVRIQIGLNKKSKIVVGGESLDSLEGCYGQSVSFETLNPPNAIRWRPALAFLDSSAEKGTVISNVDRWYYLENANGDLLDSIYVYFRPNDSVYNLVLDSANQILVKEDSADAQNQVWKISQLISLPSLKQDTLPILGAGEYQAESFINELDCLHLSDTTAVPFDRKWSANYGGTIPIDSVEYRITQYNPPNFRFRIKPMAGGMTLERIYVHGFRVLDPSRNDVEVRVESNNGYSNTTTYLVGEEGYFEIPIPTYLGVNDYVELRFDFKRDMEIQWLHLKTPAYVANNFFFHFHEAQEPGRGFLSSDYTLPIGIKYTSSLSLPETELPLVELYPNPAQTRLVLKVSEAMSTDWGIYNAGGVKVAAGFLNGNKAAIDVSDLKPGVYLFEINGQFQKLVILRN